MIIAEGSLIASSRDYVDAASLEPKMFHEARSSRGSLFFCFTELFLQNSVFFHKIKESEKSSFVAREYFLKVT